MYHYFTVVSILHLYLGQDKLDILSLVDTHKTCMSSIIYIVNKRQLIQSFTNQRIYHVEKIATSFPDRQREYFLF